MIQLLASLAFGSLVVRTATTFPLERLGYFDAYYYVHVAQNMAAGRGMVEDVVWNYLDQSAAALALPHPSHLYWMPMASWLAWLGLVLGGGVLPQFQAAMLPFAVLSSLVPPLSAWVSWRLWGRMGHAATAGLLTLFSGYYFLYWVLPDNYTPFALSVALTLLATWQATRRGGLTWWWLLAGAGAGLSHLSRADGILLLLVIALCALACRGARPLAVQVARAGGKGGLALLGYLLVFGPWLLRNLLVAGTPLPGGGLKTLWLRDYDEIWSYTLSLTPERYFAWGPAAILGSKLETLAVNTLVLLGAVLVFLAPLVLLGLRAALRGGSGSPAQHEHRLALLRPLLLYAAVLLLAMTLAFSYPSQHGSLIHSAAALVPWLMALAPAGLETVARWYARRRHVSERTLLRVLQAATVSLAAVLSVWISVGWLGGGPSSRASPTTAWNQRHGHYPVVERWLRDRGATGPLLTSNPPIYTVLAGRPSLMIPSDGVEAAAAVADRFESNWLLAEGGALAAWPADPAPAGWQLATGFADHAGNPVRLYERRRPS